MDQVENMWTTAHELMAVAAKQGIDLTPFHCEGNFEKEQRWICLWRKLDGLPCSGRSDEKEGTLHYNLQGAIEVLPTSLRESAGAFRKAWTEAGTFDNIEQAFGLLKAWLIDNREVDDLPTRQTRRCGI